MDQLETIELQTGENPSAAVIWLHGLGADGNDFAGIVPELQLPSTLAVRFVFPHAPYMPITCNNGYVMRAWYDIKYFDSISRHADVDGVKLSVELMRQLIARENVRGIPTERIILAGFSQGGAIAYTAGLTHPEPLAGIVALSTYLPAPELIKAEGSTANRNTPVFAAHGSTDPVVPVQLGNAARTTVSELGNPVQWQTYPMQHSVCLPEVLAIGEFIEKALA